MKKHGNLLILLKISAAFVGTNAGILCWGARESHYFTKAPLLLQGSVGRWLFHIWELSYGLLKNCPPCCLMLCNYDERYSIGLDWGVINMLMKSICLLSVRSSQADPVWQMISWIDAVRERRSLPSDQTKMILSRSFSWGSLFYMGLYFLLRNRSEAWKCF